MTTFAKSSISPSIPMNKGNCSCVFTNGTSGISAFSNDTGIWYSSDSINFTLTNVNIGSFSSISVNGTNAVICSSSNTGIYYSSNTGSSWTQSNITTGNFNNIFLQSINAIACSNSNTGLWYSNDSGINWTQSNITIGNFTYVHGTGGTTFIACSTSVAGLYYSIDSGQTWTSITNVNTLTFVNVYMQGTNAIALQSIAIANGSLLGIWYSINTGATWIQTTTTNSTGGSLTLTFCEISNFTGTIIASSTVGNWRSTNSGITWTRIFNDNQDIVTTNKTITNYWYSIQNAATSMYYSTNDGLSWNSNSQTSNLSIYASGTKILIGTSNNNGLKYSSDNSQTLSFALKDTSSIPSSVCVNGSNVFAVCGEGGVIYSSDGGLNYTYSSNPSGIILTNCANSGSNVVACGAGRVYYSTNNGVTLTQGTAIGLAGTPNVIYINGSIALMGSNATITTGLWRSTDGGINWTKTSLPNIRFYDIKINGSTAIACTFLNGLYYSTDSGATWTLCPQLTTNTFFSCQILTLTNIVVSCNNTQIYYSTNSGATLTQSLGISRVFLIIGYFGSNVIASSRATNFGYYYSNDSGATWIVSNITNNNGNNGFVTDGLSFIGTNPTANVPQNNVYYSTNSGITYNTTNLPIGYYYGISWSETTKRAVALGTNLIYYSTPIACFNENTTILTSSNQYILISDLKIGDELITYKDGNKKIKYIKNFKLYQNKNDPIHCMYKMKNSDFIISGGHSILVDSLTTEQNDTQKMIYGFDQKMHDKHLLLACVSEDFEMIKTEECFNLYHIVLENENIDGHYGVYANNGILTETISEKYYNTHMKNIA